MDRPILSTGLALPSTCLAGTPLEIRVHRFIVKGECGACTEIPRRDGNYGELAGRLLVSVFRLARPASAVCNELRERWVLVWFREWAR